ncbi:anti-sigma factor antagonist [Candidatus Chrysopegis kryptomonas]|uniref:Anti-sigma factor antagonist n=1 Tax=Candidatus Chryseopegocella kryptomonas TaxID=1633643 RepID=A0A0P1NU76_9BACT|nr:anti-sigma factor antagonist [Candidatus Chrysopegis kryptomonas]CUT02550.1 anti-anti-sigma factor [Candidatus Chrysopegis kryptomonas]
MLGKIFSKVARDPVSEGKKLIDVWKEFGNFMFFEKPSSEGFEFIFDVFERIVKAPAYYIYSFSESSGSLILENMRLRNDMMRGLDDEVIEALREPELKIIFRDDYKNFGFALIWAGKFLNIPLYLGESYTGNFFCGPFEPEPIDKNLANWFKEFSNACAVALRQIKLGEETRSKIRLLESQAQVSKKMLGSTLEVNKFLELLLELAITATGSDAGFIAMWDDKIKRMKIRASKNLSNEFMDALDLSPDTGLFEWIGDGEEMIVRDFEFLLKFKVNSIIGVPLVEGGKLLGIFALVNFKKLKQFEEFTIKILSAFVEQIKIVIHNVDLFNQFTERYLKTLIALAEAYDMRSEYTAGHSNRVAQLSVEIGKKLGLEMEKLRELRIAGLIHDVGMCGVVEISEDYQADYNHPIIGASMVEILPISFDIVEGIRTHQEWYDGWGFPQGLKGEEIPLFGRILGLCEFFIEMSSNSKLRKAFSYSQLETEIKKRTGSQFDPKVVSAFFEVMNEKREKAGEVWIEECWKFKGEPRDVCSRCPVYEGKFKRCWESPEIMCRFHGDYSCEDCFIFLEWVERMKTKKLEKKMEYSVVEKNNYAIVKLKGELDVASSIQARDVFKNLIDKGKVNIIIDFSELTFIDSSGLGIIVVAYRSAKEKGGTIKFANVNPRVKKLFEITRTEKHFEFYNTVEDAEKTF